MEKKENKLDKSQISLIIKIVSVVLILAIVVSLTAFAIKSSLGRKRGIILVPGLLASGLIDSETQKPIWDPFEGDKTLIDFLEPETKQETIREWLQPGMKILGDIANNKPGNLLELLTLSEDGINEHPNIVPAPFEFEGGQRYGAMQSFRKAYDAIKERYPKDEVTVLNCDWRIDNRESAKRLEKFICDKGYTDVVLVGHSMGNNIISAYLARSEANRAKVVAYISLAGPHYGSLMALSMLENLDDMLESYVKEYPFLKDILLNKVYPFGMSLASLVQLLPTPELLKTAHYDGGKIFAVNNGAPLKTEDKIMEFYKSRKWSFKVSDGELKKFVKEIQEYNNSFYVETEQGKKHASELVPTYYFAGNGVSTETCVYSDDDGYKTSDRLNEGDGTVLFYSATLGKEIHDYKKGEKITKDSCFVTGIEGADHFHCGVYFDGKLKEKVFEYLDEIHKMRRFNY